MSRNRVGAAVPRKNWTVMVYLSGDNDLSEECVWSLKEMFRAGVDSSVALVVQIDPKGSKPRRFDVGKFFEDKAQKLSLSKKRAAQRATELDMLRGEDGVLFGRGRSLPKLRVPATGPQNYIRTDIEPNVGTDDMASTAVLRRFIRHCRNTHPADHYMLILSGHGGSALGHSFLLDGFPPRAMSMAEVAKAIRNTLGKDDARGKSIDIVGMDSCGMGMAEVGYELRGCADYLVASEGFEQNTGWPYHKLLEIVKDSTLKPRAVAARIVEAHTAYYADFLMAGVSTDMAACEIEKSANLADKVHQLADILKDTLPDNTGDPFKRTHVEQLDPRQRMASDAIILAHWRAQSYGFERQTDLYDFCDSLQNGMEYSAVTSACSEVMTAIEGKALEDGTNDGYVIKSLHSGGTFQHSHGAAVYFPWAEFSNDYNKLGFSTATCWGEFVKAYVQRTRRCPRPGSGPLLFMSQGDGATDVKDFPEHGVRDFPEHGVRNFPEFGIKNFPEFGIRFANAIVPQVKNPPDVFRLNPTEGVEQKSARVRGGRRGGRPRKTN